MPRSTRPATTPRKQPVQARSSQLVADILSAAARVLEREGPHRFTTGRVAETAGVSVGSLYQYFPNKHSILYRLQLDEWERTGAAIDALLGDTTRSPEQRLRAMIHHFFQSECEEAPLRLALDAFAPSYHDSPESHAGRARSQRIVTRFITAAAPHATPTQRRFASDLLFTTITATGKQLSETPRSAAELRRWSDAMAEMLLGYLRGLGPRARRGAGQ